MSGLRFCLLTTFYPPQNFGGDGIGVQRLARALVRRGHQVTVVHDPDAFAALRGRSRGGPGDADDDGVEVVRLRSPLGSLSPLLTHLTGRPIVHGRSLRRLLNAKGFDVVHLNNVSLIGGPGLFPYGRGVKLYEAHEHWLVCPAHVLWRHNREACTGRQCLRCVLHFGRPPQLWRYTGLLERHLSEIDAFIAKSSFSRDKHREFGVPGEMEVLPYFLPDDEAGGAASLATPQSRPYFLFVGRLEPIKGLADVLPLFDDGSPADLLVAGDGTQAEALRRAAAGRRRIRFLGRLTPAELRGYYENALALLVPSVGFETFGIILIEAMRHGTPVIARRIGPFPEIVERGGGLLFDDVDHLRSLLQRLSIEPGLRERLSREGRQAFREHWSEAVVVPRYLELVRRLATAKGMQPVAAAATAETVS